MVDCDPRKIEIAIQCMYRKLNDTIYAEKRTYAYISFLPHQSVLGLSLQRSSFDSKSQATVPSQESDILAIHDNLTYKTFLPFPPNILSIRLSLTGVYLCINLCRTIDTSTMTPLFIHIVGEPSNTLAFTTKLQLSSLTI